MSVAIVTGANRGIGFELCGMLEKRGFTVVMAGRDPARLAQARDELLARGANPERLVALHLDQADAATVAPFVASFRERFPGLDLLVNNAGIAPDGLHEAVARRTITVNYETVTELTESLLPCFGSRIRIANVSSAMGELACVALSLRQRFETEGMTRAGLDGLVGEFLTRVRRREHIAAGWPGSAYRVSKLALNCFTRRLAAELGDRAHVNAVCPGWVRTKMGGPSAPRTVEDGASAVLWAAVECGGTGYFLRDQEQLRW